MKYSEWIAPLVLFGVILIAIAPSNGWLDTSELSSASYLIGIGHPPGQPLYSMLGKMSQFMPFGSLAFRINLLSAIFLMLSLMVFRRIVSVLFRDFDSRIYKIISILIGTYFFLTYPFMIQGVRTELYSLNLFLSLLILCFFIDGRYQLIGFFLVGLSFGCHPLLGLFLLPGAFVLVLTTGRRVSFYFKGFFFVALGASIYLYLPLRAQANPIYNFGNPDNFKSFMWVISGALYKAYEKFETVKIYDNISNLFYIFFEGINPIFFWLSIIGLSFLAIKRFKIGVAFMIILLANASLLLVNMHFDIYNPDAHGYLMISFVALGVGCVYFFFVLVKKINGWISDKHKYISSIALIFIFLLTSIYQVYRFFPDYNKKGDWSAQSFGRYIVEDLPYGSFVFTGSFATYSILSHSIFCESFRGDLKLLFTGFMKNEGYFKNVKSNYPEIKVDALDSEYKFDRDLLDSIAEVGSPIFVELAIKQKQNSYGIRQGDEILNLLGEYEWFFKFNPSGEKSSSRAYIPFWDNKIIKDYPNSDYEFKKQILFEIFLHSKFFLFKKDFEKVKYLISNGLKLNSYFEPFVEIQKEVDALK